MRSDFETVLQMARALVQNDAGNEAVTRDLIARSVDGVMRMNSRWASTVDSAQVIAELETRFSIWIGRERVLKSDDGHVPWLKAARKTGWRYWQRYREWLDATWSPHSVDALDRVTDRVIGLLEDPAREGAWDRRGLVVGHVQSGKTANYTGLISKAADAGYKVLLVLTGIHKNLRSQTQMRLDEGFLGYETMPPAAARSAAPRTIGVGIINSDPAIMPDYVTNRSDNGDFNRTVANSMGISPGQRPLLFVIKKNAHVLRNLLSWVEERVANVYENTGRRIVERIPLLLIDDEADHASVDTGEQSFDENGNPDPDYDPKTINSLIRRLLFAFEKSAYVGYTATPFANIFIHEKGKTAEEGEDLFPRSFIVNLPAASNYVGPVRLFGLESADDPNARVEPLDLVRHVRDHAASEDPNERSGWMPPKHRNGHVPLFQERDEIPDSLKEAIHAFLLSCAARKVRSTAPHHSSMLIHVTRYNSVQAQVRRQVEEYLVSLRRRIVYGEGSASTTMADFRKQWTDDFVPATANVRRITGDSSITGLAWNDIKPLLAQVVQDVQTRQIDGSAGDILDYETHRETGFTVIAIGGDKLSRGLTLEGLMVSYFLRATRMYDTLMQMGRWFGYRAAHLDLCRLYTSPDLEEWFEHVTEASEELRREFDHMVAVGGTPRDYGLKVQSHPILMVTSRVKMRNSAELRLSFSGNVQENVVFYREEDRLRRNVRAAESLIRSMGASFQRHPTRDRPSGRHRWDGTFLWDGVDGNRIVSFLRDYSTHPDAVKVNGRILAEFIEKKSREGELVSWTVALMSGEAEADPVGIGGLDVRMVHRAVNTRCYSLDQQKQDQRYLIRRLLAPRDEAIDLGKDEYAAALAMTVEEYELGRAASRRSSPPGEPSGIHIRHVRGLGSPSRGVAGHPERGLLLLYPLSPAAAEIVFDGPVMAFGVSFPASSTSTTVTYKVNNVYWNQEYETEE